MNVVIDEVMTSCRWSGELLLAFTLGLPGCFSHAIIGKWPSIGVIFRISEWSATENQDCGGETTVAAAAVAAFGIVRSFNKIRGTLPDHIRKTRDFTTAAVTASVHARDKVDTKSWSRGCLIFSNVQHAGSDRGAWCTWQDFWLTVDRFTPRVRLLSQGVQQPLGLRNMQLVAKCNEIQYS